ncbi:hypothetical protein OGAPHI_005731 [Ogataea philodendri]|uniref:Uncharacterized protein n=1 Tax=Ogataea philodendri TaxID=1378263 RepID=A0A9P8T1T4_9ASCO|nr:uncharacterized protein OGAPHI_005731 [Ogataea philodendri]KAH3662479.1 hypothetical protein OGAPHI_005731 [Ogataea philodendri]
MHRPKHRNTHSVHYNSQTAVAKDQLAFKLRSYGYLILALSATVFVVTVGTMLGAWKWVFSRPLMAPWVASSKVVDSEGDEIIDSYYLFAFALNFVILWIWCVVSWISMKLFRHSKGSGYFSLPAETAPPEISRLISFLDTLAMDFCSSAPAHARSSLETTVSIFWRLKASSTRSTSKSLSSYNASLIRRLASPSPSPWIRSHISTARIRCPSRRDLFCSWNSQIRAISPVGSRENLYSKLETSASKVLYRNWYMLNEDVKFLSMNTAFPALFPNLTPFAVVSRGTVIPKAELFFPGVSRSIRSSPATMFPYWSLPPTWISTWWWCFRW